MGRLCETILGATLLAFSATATLGLSPGPVNKNRPQKTISQSVEDVRSEDIALPPHLRGRGYSSLNIVWMDAIILIIALIMVQNTTSSQGRQASLV